LLLQEEHGFALGARRAGRDFGALALQQLKLLVEIVCLLR
jgi:hypothetical protein